MELVITKLLQKDLQRLKDFIEVKNPRSASEFAQRISHVAALIKEQPFIGRACHSPSHVRKDIRKVVICIGQATYQLRYQILKNEIRLLRLYHAKEIT